MIEVKQLQLVNLHTPITSGIEFVSFGNLEMFHYGDLFSEQNQFIATTPFQVCDYSGLPLHNVVNYSNQLLARRHSSNCNELHINLESLIYLGYSHNPSNYFHFMIEVVPRMIIARQVLGTNLSAIVPENTPIQILEIYERVLGGYLQIAKDTCQLTKFSDLVVTRDFRHPKLVDYTDSNNGNNCFASRQREIHTTKSTMEDLFLNDTNQVSPKESRFPKVFLTRSKFLGRVPENLEALESTLEVLGFRVINTEFMSLRDQISLFSNVEVVISLSGAALTNLMFCKSKTQVFFIPPDLSLFSYVFWSDYAKLFNLDFMTLDSVVEGDSGEIYRVDIDNLIGIIATHS
jgi:hypothetical protein